jgi:hypothetical protein
MKQQNPPTETSDNQQSALGDDTRNNETTKTTDRDARQRHSKTMKQLNPPTKTPDNDT